MSRAEAFARAMAALSSEPPRLGRRILAVAVWVTAVVGAVVVLCVVLAVPSVLSGVHDARLGRALLQRFAATVGRGDADAAQRLLEAAKLHFDAASERFGSPWTSPARGIPIVSRQLQTARALARSASLAAQAGSTSVEALSLQPADGWTMRKGTIDLGALRKAGAVLRAAEHPARRSAEEVAAAPGSWLVPPLARARASVERAVSLTYHTIAKATVGLEAAPSLLGENEPRRYLVMHSNLAELRGTGGLLGFFAVIDANRGALRLLPPRGRPSIDLPALQQSESQPPPWYLDTWGRYEAARTWHNVNMTTDFPTVAKLVVDAVSASPGPVDGVMQIDPYGLAALLALTGPVELAGWPEPVSSANVARITQHDVYIRFTDAAARDGFAERLVGAIFEKIFSSDVHLDLEVLGRLAESVTGGHIKVYVADVTVQKALQEVGIAGDLARADGATDVLGVFNENASPNKVDWFLRRSVSYEVQLDPQTDTALAKLTVDLRNDAPPDGLPEYILGPNEGNIAPGENRTIVVILRPPKSRLQWLTVDGRPAVATIDRERNLYAYQLAVTIPPGETLRIEAVHSIDRALRFEESEQTFRLHVLHQPVAVSDRYEIRVTSPVTWRLSGPATLETELSQDAVVELRVSPSRPLHSLESIGRLLRELVFR